MNEIIQGITAIPAITVLCLLGAQFLKSFTPLDNKHLPALCGLVGAVLGIVCYIWTPGYIPCENAVVAAAIGAVSGWGATGANQVLKQYTKGES
jgi:hypothetical protein